MYRLYFLFCLFAWSQAQIPYLGFCPEYVPMAHFDMNRFLGKWYEAERYFQFSELGSRCVVTDYAVGPNGKLYVSNEVTNRFTGVKRVIGGNLDLSSKRTDGKMVIKYNTAPISTTSTLAILDTDYDNYAVIYSCGGFGPVNAQSAWLMTRERIPDAQTLQKAYGVLDRYKINRSFFVKTDQEGCAIAASDLNAALGIASTSTNVEQTAAIDSTSSQRESVDFKAQPIATIFFNKAADEYSSSNKKEIVADKEVILPIKTDIELLPETTSLKYSKELVNKVEEKPSNETKASENFIENHEEEKSAATVVLMKPADTNTTSENILEQN